MAKSEWVVDNLAEVHYDMLMLTPQHIREIRKAMGMNSTAFAMLLGVTQNTIARWEIGDRFPRRQHMEKLNELLEKAQKKHGLVLTA